MQIKDETSTGEMDSNRDIALAECDLPQSISRVARWIRECESL